MKLPLADAVSKLRDAAVVEFVPFVVGAPFAFGIVFAAGLV